MEFTAESISRPVIVPRREGTLPRVRLILLGLYVAALACIGFWPTPVDRPLAGFIADILSALRGHSLTAGIGYGGLEGTANVILFVPLGLLCALLLPARRWWHAAVAGLLTSASIETVQFLLLGERQASLRDVANNSLGALLGALAVRLAPQRHRTPETTPDPGQAPHSNGAT